MKIISILLTLVGFGIGAFFMVAKYERYVENQNIKALNARTANANRVIDAINTTDAVSRDCTNWLVAMATTGEFDSPYLSGACGKMMTENANKITAQISLVAAKESEPGRAAFLKSAEALANVFRSQSADFNQAYGLLAATDDEAARAALAPRVTGLVQRANSSINSAIDALDTARKGYLFPNS